MKQIFQLKFGSIDNLNENCFKTQFLSNVHYTKVF